jgi:hypothetical protein
VRHTYVSNDLDGRAAEAAYRFVTGVKDLKEAIDSGEFKNCSGACRHPRKLNVAIPFHCFFKATEQHVDSRPVHLANSGTIQHEAGPVDIHAAFQLAEEDTSLLRVH